MINCTGELHVTSFIGLFIVPVIVVDSHTDSMYCAQNFKFLHKSRYILRFGITTNLVGMP